MELINQPIIIVDDDLEDLELIADAYKSLSHQNKLISLQSGEELFSYLVSPDTEAPFFILCDVNMPKHSGFDVREKLIKDKTARYKSVPFLLWSTTAVDAQVKKAYDTMIQGYFVKPTSYKALQLTLETITIYWKLSQHPKK